MKKTIVVLAIVFGFAGTVSAGGEETISRRAQETFKKEFPSAEFARWEEIEEEDVYVVHFVYDDQGFVAYINQQGTMMASARLVTKQNLPYKVSQAIRKKHNDDEIVKIEELTMDATLSYFFTIYKDGRKIVLRIYHDGSMQKIRDDKGEIEVRP